MLSAIPLETAPKAYSAMAVTLVERLATEGRTDDALLLIGRLPSATGLDAVIPVLNRVAGKLRTDENYREALALYRRIIGIVEAEDQALPSLWIAYCELALGNESQARDTLSSVGELPTEHEAFALLLLVQGKLALQKDDYDAAMRTVSRGVVSSDMSSEWAAELSYLSAYCYQALGSPEAARSIYQEVQLLYRDTVWAQRAAQQLASLPEPVEPASASESELS